MQLVGGVGLARDGASNRNGIGASVRVLDAASKSTGVEKTAIRKTLAEKVKEAEKITSKTETEPNTIPNLSPEDKKKLREQLTQKCARILNSAAPIDLLVGDLHKALFRFSFVTQMVVLNRVDVIPNVYPEINISKVRDKVSILTN